MGRPSDRALAWLALLAAVWCVVLAPIQSAVSAAGFAGPEPLIVRLMAPLVDAAAAFHDALGRGVGSYEFWGRFFAPVYLGIAAGLVALRRGAREHPAARRAATLATGAAVVGAITDAGAYWSYGTGLQPILWSGGFGVELLALAVLGLALAWLGFALLRLRRPIQGASLLAGLALVIPSMLAVDYMPHGALLPVSFAVAIATVLQARRAPVLA